MYEKTVVRRDQVTCPRNTYIAGDQLFLWKLGFGIMKISADQAESNKEKLLHPASRHIIGCLGTSHTLYLYCNHTEQNEIGLLPRVTESHSKVSKITDFSININFPDI